MADHIAIDELALSGEGLLDPDRSAAVELHLADCAECRAHVESLSRVSAVLRAEPTPTMPPEVALRLSSVLSQESARRAAGAGSMAGGSMAGGSMAGGSVLRGGYPGPGRIAPRPTLGLFGANLPKPAKRRWLVPVLAAAVAATIVGFGGYVLSASAGLNEPPTVATAVNTKKLGSDARRVEQGGDLDPHRFSRAWQCARQVTEGRIVGLASTVVDGAPALLVYTRSHGETLVTVVTGCDGTPLAGPSAPVGR